jgi:hypothetical protein
MKLIPAEFYPPGLLYGFKMKLMTKRPVLQVHGHCAELFLFLTSEVENYNMITNYINYISNIS